MHIPKGILKGERDSGMGQGTWELGSSQRFLTVFLPRRAESLLNWEHLSQFHGVVG